MTSRTVAGLLAISALAAGAAHARPDVHVSIQVHGQAPVHRAAQPVYVPAPQPVHLPAPQALHGAVHGPAQCHAPRWNPHVRYMPGQVVRRHGDLWVARRISARVWNENSPPEWTPQYWSPAVCG